MDAAKNLPPHSPPAYSKNEEKRAEKRNEFLNATDWVDYKSPFEIFVKKSILKTEFWAAKSRRIRRAID